MKIVKIGGNVVDNPDALLSFLKDFSQLAGPKILVHGGGKEATRLGEAPGIIKATRRCPEPIDYGFVGDIDPLDVNDRMLASLTDRGLTPVICAIMHDGAGTLLNCNADTVASATAIGMARRGRCSLIYCFEKPGVLTDPDDDSSVIERIDCRNFEELKASGAISKGMIPKISNALAAIASGVSEVIIKSSADLLSGGGTFIKART